MKKYLLLIFVSTVFAISACKEETPVTPERTEPLIAAGVQLLDINDFRVQLDTKGELMNGSWQNADSHAGYIFLSGLWIGAEENGEYSGNIISTNSQQGSNYTSDWDGKELGVFALNSGVNYSPDGWPVNYGAPVNQSGSPKIYGDGMCFTVLRSDTTIKEPAFLAKPIRGLRVTQAVYGYQSSSLRNAIFIKYGITNTGNKLLNNLYSGFYADTDISTSFLNQTGYDSARALSYTYEKDNNYVCGFTFLGTPKNVSVLSHRIMRKNNYYDADFGEYTFLTPENILLALKGLSNSGQPMINPVTGKDTKFAFTGDPVKGTGWLDKPVDVRSMISTGSFSLGPGETVWIDLVWIADHESDLEKSLNKLKSDIDLVRADKKLWQ